MTNMFSMFPKEKIRIIKQDNSIIDDVSALVESETIFIDDSTVDLYEGDIIERELPTGAKEQFLVLDKGYHRGVHSIPDHYQAKVQKQTEYAKIGKGQIIHNYTINNAERVNINSTDNSSNYNISSPDLSLMEELRTIAKDLDNGEEIVSAVNDMQNNIGKKTFAEKYNAFIQSAANHMTLFAPFIPVLSTLLTQSPIN